MRKQVTYDNIVKTFDQAVAFVGAMKHQFQTDAVTINISPIQEWQSLHGKYVVTGYEVSISGEWEE